MQFGEMLNDLVKVKFKSRRAFARVAEPSRDEDSVASHISKISRGILPPPLDRIEKWADALDLKGVDRHEFSCAAALAHIPQSVTDMFESLQKDRFAEFVRDRMDELGIDEHELASRINPDDPMFIEVLWVSGGTSKPPEYSELEKWAKALELKGFERDHFLELANIAKEKINYKNGSGTFVSPRLGGIEYSVHARLADSDNDQDWHAVEREGEAAADDQFTLSVAGTVTAGDGWAQVDESDTTIKLRSGLVAVQVRGDSADPLVQEGQWVLANPGADWDDIPIDDVVIVQTRGGDAYCKRWSGVHGGQVVLTSINSGRGSVVLSNPEQLTVWPVVGVLFNEALK